MNGASILSKIIYKCDYFLIINIMKSLFKNFLKEDPIESALTKYQLFSDSTTTINLNTLLKYYQKLQQEHKEEALIDILILQIEKKKSIIAKLKMLIFLLSISKISQYDVTDLITRKKLKTFTQDSKKKTQTPSIFELSAQTKQIYTSKHILMPIYNYMIKLSANEELYKVCQSGQVPCDEIFRRGNRIRYIWVFKIFNLINLLLPLLSPILIVLQKFPKQFIFVQVLQKIKSDLAFYVNFITRCLQQTSVTNPFLLPYNDCLQYYQSLKQYRMFKFKNQKLLNEVSAYAPQPAIKFMEIDETSFAELQVLAVRIQLISTSLRTTNNKENERMITEYNQKMQKYETRLKTQND